MSVLCLWIGLVFVVAAIPVFRLMNPLGCVGLVRGLLRSMLVIWLLCVSGVFVKSVYAVSVVG
jgi:hypothetical protein